MKTKRFFLPLLMAVVMMAMCPTTLWAQTTSTVLIGGDSDTEIESRSGSNECPFGSSRKNSTTVTLYTHDQINVDGKITSIAYYSTSTSSSKYQNVKIYMKLVDASTTELTTDFNAATAGFTLVYSGADITIGSYKGWNGYALNTPFQYDRKKNLLIAITRQNNYWSYNYDPKFYCISTSGVVRTIMRNDDNDNSYANLNDATSFSNTYDNQACLKLNITQCDHEFSGSSVTSPTCEGSKSYCTKCGLLREDGKTPATNPHNYNSATHYCTVCEKRDPAYPIVTYTATGGTKGYNSSMEYTKLFDGDTSTKWYVYNKSNKSTIYVEFSTKVNGTKTPVYVSGYSFTTANDNLWNKDRCPKTWKLKAKVNSSDAEWTVLHTVTDNSFIKDVNTTTYYFELPTHTTTAYQYFRLEITNASNIEISEFALEATDIDYSTQTATKQSTKAPTCNQQGYDVMAYDDGYTYKTGFKNPTEVHEYNTETYTCDNCGVYNPDVVAYTGTDNTCYWYITKDGEMVFAPLNGVSGTLSGWLNENERTWYSNVSDITSVRFTGNITAQTMSNMFYNCTNLETVDFTNLNTDKVQYMPKLFKDCKKLKAITWANVNTEKVISMSEMFSGCHVLPSLDLSSFNTANVTNMSYMFDNCKRLKSVDLSSFNTANVTNMSYMFNYCEYLTSLNVSKFNTAKVKDMSYMFNGCYVLPSLDLSSFNTALVTNMDHMFYFCKDLPSLDLSSFNTVNVTNMDWMFYYCEALTSLTIGNFDMQKVEKHDLMLSNTDKLMTLTLKALPYLVSGSYSSCFKNKFTKNKYYPDVTVNYDLQLNDNSMVYEPTAEKPNNLPDVINWTAAPSYTREMSNEWGTIVVPFAVKYDAHNTNYRLYQLSAANDITSTTGTLTFTGYDDNAIIPAGTPIAIRAIGKKINGKYTVTLTANENAVNTTITSPDAVAGLTMKGTYTKKENQTGMYFVAKNKFYYAESPISIAPYRAWFDAASGATAKSFEIVIEENGETTSIGSVNSEQLTVNKAAVKFFDNGRVVIVKNGKKFNINGQEVK